VHGRDHLVPHGPAGLAASVEQLATKIDQIMIPCAEVAAKAPFAPITITGGVLADEAMQLFAK
jgi:tRNA(adenine34) deaminase